MAVPLPPQRSIVVLGAGVIGLSIAYVLSADPANEITVVARDMPENLDSQAWSSPWAGANWSPIGDFDERTHRWEKITFNRLWDMIPTGLVMELPARVYHTNPDALSKVWWKDIVRNFRVLPPEDLSPEGKLGLAYTTVSAKPAHYLAWLKGELVERGVNFVTKFVGSVEEAAGFGGENSVVVNATAIGARSLIGVEDRNVYPIRGQTTIVHAPHVRECVHKADMHLSTTGEATYIIPRVDGTVILGGTYQSDNWDTTVDYDTTRRIMENCVALLPQLRHDVKILSHNVGLRRARRGGARVEIETLRLPLKHDLVPNPDGTTRPSRDLTVIHAYGFGAAGYQMSWGVAEDVASLLALT